MAAQTENGDQGTMDISEHQRTWKGFMRFIVWQCLGILFVMVLLMIFRTHG